MVMVPAANFCGEAYWCMLDGTYLVALLYSERRTMDAIQVKLTGQSQHR